MDDIKREIVCEIYVALDALGAPFELLSVIGSWGDSMDDHDTLSDLRAFNEAGTIFAELICATPEVVAERDRAMARRTASTSLPESAMPGIDWKNIGTLVDAYQSCCNETILVWRKCDGASTEWLMNRHPAEVAGEPGVTHWATISKPA